MSGVKEETLYMSRNKSQKIQFSVGANLQTFHANKNVCFYGRQDKAPLLKLRVPLINTLFFVCLLVFSGFPRCWFPLTG